MTLSEELKWRGFVNQTTYADIKTLDNSKAKFYHGYDAGSSDSLTIGNLAAVMMDKVLLRHGIQGVIVAGGATSLIGDPGGKDTERPLQSVEVVESNVESIKQQLKQLLGDKAVLVNNLDWFKDMKVIDFLRDVGKYFSMTPLVQRDYIAKRMGKGGSGISYTELSYTLLQGYDFLQLFDKYGVNLQLAGSDQWGNGLSGVELVKKVRNAEVNVLTCPLIINRATGNKFGKSEAGAVWLDPGKTSPMEFYQYWISLDDEGAEDYLKIFTELDKEQIEDIVVRHKKDPSKRLAQTTLAFEVARIVHGEVEAKLAQQNTGVITGELDLSNLSSKDLPELGIKSITVAHLPYSLVEILTTTGLASSNVEARRLINDQAIYINDISFSSEEISKAEFGGNKFALIRKGKNRANSAIIELR